MQWIFTPRKRSPSRPLISKTPQNCESLTLPSSLVPADTSSAADWVFHFSVTVWMSFLQPVQEGWLKILQVELAYSHYLKQKCFAKLLYLFNIESTSIHCLPSEQIPRGGRTILCEKWNSPWHSHFPSSEGSYLLQCAHPWHSASPPLQKSQHQHEMHKTKWLHQCEVSKQVWDN